MNKKKIILILLCCSLLGTVTLSGCNGKEEPTPEEEYLLETPMIAEVVTGTVMSEGTVVPVQSASITFPRDGIIMEVLINEGEEVEEDQVLARLDGAASLKAAVAAAEADLLDAQKNYNDLYDNAEKQRAAAKLTLAQAESALDTAKDRAQSKDFKQGDQEDIEGAYAEYILAVEKVKDLEEDFQDEFVDKLENDYGRAEMQAKLSAARNERDNAWDRYDKLNSQPDEFDVAVMEAELEVAQSQYDKAKEDYQDVEENGVNPDDLALAEAAVKNAEAQLEAAKTNLSDIELKAPFNGVIMANDLKVGETIEITSSSGVPPMITLADISEWEIETTDLTELDVVEIKTGSTATVTFDAIPDLELTGIVSDIRLVGESKQGDITYTVTVKLDKQDDRLLWNMTSFVIFDE